MVPSARTQRIARGLAREPLAVLALEAADLPFGFLVADAVASLQLADEHVAATVDLLHIVVGQFAPLFLYRAFALRPGALDLGPRHAGLGLDGGSLGMDEAKRRADREARHNDGES